VVIKEFLGILYYHELGLLKHKNGKQVRIVDDNLDVALNGERRIQVTYKRFEQDIDKLDIVEKVLLK